MPGRPANKPVRRQHSTPVAKDQPVSETHSNIRGKALKVKDYSIANLMKRFQFTLVGRETLNGRTIFVVDFKPLSKDLPVNQFADKFINKAAGRIWVDAEDYAIAQAQVHLTEQVNVLGGMSARSGNSPMLSPACGRRKATGLRATWTGISKAAKWCSTASLITTSRSSTRKKSG